MSQLSGWQMNVLMWQERAGELARELKALQDECDRLRSERDEARREACGHDEYIGGAMLEADRRGWDCFKQEAKQ